MSCMSRISLALLLLFLWSPTTSVMAQPPPKLIGTWHMREAGLTIVFVFNPDGTGKLPIRPINFPFPEFQAAGREQHPTPAVAGCPPVTRTRVSVDVGYPRRQHA